ncbi:glycoside hydrolase family protein [Leptolyngbya sp. NIES-2104]|uniref:glycoside hydrolase family protein n=1 Tax=Leptolyngbya sp. NIES-2104 TaxID=1552121 RepID=UPI0006EC9624|nr:glycoside hydrolase family protein [Leptolyngbya sp. NIES-2104]GAP96278.1 phage lysin [Leptolyngbya sp. NIES-2104]
MTRSLELYNDGRLYEFEDDQTVKVTETHGQVRALIEALRFSIASTFTLALPNQQPPNVPATRAASKHLNAEGFKLLTTFEGCRLEAYDDGVGVWTIGYGHTRGVFQGMTINQAQAEEFLREDLEQFESYVEDAVSVTLTDNQFSALVCFCFNVGPGAEGFGGSTLLRLLNTGDYQGAANQLIRWNKAGGESWLGLTRRRLAERALFLSSPWQSFVNYEGTGEEVVGLATKAPRTLRLTEPLMQGEDVRQVQEALVSAGIALKADSFFGKDTDKAVKQFQQQHNLEMVDGVVGAATRKALGLPV